MYGWAGKFLRVDLTSETITPVPLESDFAQDFLGGMGFANKLIFDQLNPKIKDDPFGPDNLVCVIPGTFCGTFVPGASRLQVSVTLNPFSGTFSDGNAGGHFGPELKYAGWDGILLRGRARNWVYLCIQDDRVELRDARHLVGKTVWEADTLLKAELGDPDIHTLLIGPAGENRVTGAMAAVDRTRAPAGGSNGAILGSKRLKGIVVRGTQGVRVADPAGAFALYQEVYRRNTADPVFPKWSREGTKWLVDLLIPLGAGAYNAQEERSFPFEKITSRVFMENFSGKHTACHACFTHCSHRFTVRKGPYAGTCGDGGEAGVIHALGVACGNSDYESILHLTNLVNSVGMDAIATGMAIATCMHWWQDGLLTEKETGGLQLEWGNARDEAELIRQMAFREGFGDLLASGTSEVARLITEARGVPLEQVERYIMANKKKKEVILDPRATKGWAFSSGINIRICDSMTVEISYTGKKSLAAEDFVAAGFPQEVAQGFIAHRSNDPTTFQGKAYGKIFYEHFATLCNALGVCQRYTPWEMMPFGIELFSRCTGPILGKEYSWKELERCGERIWNLQQAIQVRLGLRKKDDFLPDRLYDNPVKSGMLQGATISRREYEAELENYYRLRGWSSEGIPSREKLEELGLEEVAQVLERERILPLRGNAK